MQLFLHDDLCLILGAVPNLRGRVLSSESETATVERGLYVVGWLKRGPTGIVATNLHCAEETVGTFVPLLSFILCGGPMVFEESPRC